MFKSFYLLYDEGFRTNTVNVEVYYHMKLGKNSSVLNIKGKFNTNLMKLVKI